MPPKLYGTEHIVYLVCALCVIVAVVLVVQYVCKSEKQRTIALKVVAGLLLLWIVINRISLAVWKQSALQLLPNSYCGMSSLLLSLAVLILKPRNKTYDFLFWLELVGGIATIFYPNFISQADTFWFVPTISGFVHHTLGVLLCIMLVQCGHFRPSLKRWKMFPIGLSIYTIYGLFLYDVLGIPDTMQIDKPLIDGTPLSWWFMLIVGTAAIVVFLVIYELIVKRINKNKQAKQQAADASQTEAASTEEQAEKSEQVESERNESDKVPQ